jgi:allophanate hydrolase subunit 2
VPPTSLEVPVLLGPRDDWFADPVSALRSAVWTVSSRSNRIGLRLDGDTPLRRTEQRDGVELSSEPMLPGAVQVPPNGLPVIFLADGPTTGGYPVVGVVPAAALPALAQARPGTRVRLTPRCA